MAWQERRGPHKCLLGARNGTAQQSGDVAEGPACDPDRPGSVPKDWALPGVLLQIARKSLRRSPKWLLPFKWNCHSVAGFQHSQAWA